VNLVITDVNIVESSTDSDGSNEEYNINNNNIVNNSRISNNENRNINISDN